ncbi:MAG: putative molybdenum carrier protein [Thermodesulfobacteriota bacterium]
MIQKIISGAQTGADRAGIDAAIESGVDYGGWLPDGRKAEDGIVPQKYTKLQEIIGGNYPARTEQNVIDSDGTVIFGYGKLTTGSALTRKLAKQHKRPYLHIDLDVIKEPVPLIKDWIIEWNIKVLNIAGRKASKAPGIYDKVKDIIKQVLK